MKKNLNLVIAGILTLCANSVLAQTWTIGDNDGYGIGIPDNANHTFNGFTANFDGRSAAEAAATDGAQYTDTYSTTHADYGPQSGSIATFIFTELGNGWTEGSMWFDMADFQATTFGAVNTTYNGIAQNWAFNDGFPSTNVRFFDLGQDVIDSINTLGMLTIAIDRANSGDFYGFDYTLLSNRLGEDTDVNAVPVPAALPLMASALGLFGISRRKNKKQHN
jgi:hypothetical protein